MGRCQKLYDEGKDPTKGLSMRTVIGKSTLERFAFEKPEKQRDKKYAKFKVPETALAGMN
jgi:hypothetical protein